jgi:D-sedoheptulose 7-phosphate isomerase
MQRIDSYLTQIARVLLDMPRGPIATIVEALWDTYQRDGTILICGNGGSAATASHFACDLAKATVRASHRRVRALALTDNVPVMTAWSNDQSYSDVFVEQLKTVYRPGDLLVAISGSGNSSNVLRAVAWAIQCGAPTVGLSGFDGGTLAHLARYSLHIANSVMPQVEDIHMAICHALATELAERVEQAPSDTLETVEISDLARVETLRLVVGQ